MIFPFYMVVNVCQVHGAQITNSAKSGILASTWNSQKFFPVSLCEGLNVA